MITSQNEFLFVFFSSNCMCFMCAQTDIGAYIVRMGGDGKYHKEIHDKFVQFDYEHYIKHLGLRGI